MSDYTKTTDFAAKDALASGNPAKAAKGTEVDVEFDNISTAIATKYDINDRDVASGLCPLDASSLVPPGNLPAATTTAVGALEVATSAEATALTVDNKIITPLKSVDTFEANILNGATVTGLLDDIYRYTDPAADALWGWDDGTNSLANFAMGTGLAFNAFTIEVDMLGLEDLVDPGADRIYFWDDGGGAANWLAPGNGLEIATTTLGLVDVAASATNAIDITSGSVTLDFSSLTALDIAGSAATDSIVVNDGGVLKQMDIQDMGIRVVEVSVAQTFAAEDATTLQLLTGATARTWDIPTNAAVGYAIGTIIYVGSRDTALLTISPNTSAVRLTSINGSDVGPSAGDQQVKAGGVAALIKVATNEWMITGDLQ
jgi:hypothetical protein